MDKILENALRKERVRQEANIELIASENYVSNDILKLQGSILTNKYAEGYPAKRYYGGCEYIDIFEDTARSYAKKLFGAKFANVQPHSGSSANMAVYRALLNHGDKVMGMNLSNGGHLTHGHKMSFSGMDYEIVDYDVDPNTEMIDYEAIKEKALNEHIPIIMDDTLEVIENIMKEIKPTAILEIGTAVGYSAICFSKFLEKGGFIDTIERDEERIKEAKENIKIIEDGKTINILEGDAVEILPTINKKYDMVFIDAAKGKYPFFLEQALRLIKDDGIIFADNILYKGYVMSDYNKHKQRTAVTHLREYIKLTTDNPRLDTKILEVGDGLAITRIKK